MDRMAQINRLIRQAISPIILDLLSDSIIAISHVDTSKDLSYCDISVMDLSNQDEKVAFLNSKAKLIRSELSDKVKLRKLPLIRFHRDQSEEKADKIDQLLREI